MDVSVTVFEILTLLENSLFFHPTITSRPLALRYQRNLYIAEKYILMGYIQFRR